MTGTPACLESAGVARGDREAVSGWRWLAMEPSWCRKALARVARGGGEIGIATGSVQIEGQDSWRRTGQSIPSSVAASFSLRRPSGSALTPNREFRDGDAGEIERLGDLRVQPVPARRGAGSGFIASETTLVSSTIIQSSWAWQVCGRGPVPAPRNRHWSIPPPGSGQTARSRSATGRRGRTADSKNVAHLGLGAAAMGGRRGPLSARCTSLERLRMVTAGMMASPVRCRQCYQYRQSDINQQGGLCS